MKKIHLLSFFILLLLGSCSQKAEKGSSQDNLSVDSVQTVHNQPKEPEPIVVALEKDLTYDKYTLDDTYPYKDTTREFQWDKIKDHIKVIETAQREPSSWGIVQNRKNVNGLAPLARNVKRNEYNNLQDPYGVERYQSIPLYLVNDLEKPERYATDGSLIKILDEDSNFYRAECIYIGDEWMIPKKYVKRIADSVRHFSKVVIVDRHNQNTAVLEKIGSTWKIRSMNPATTGVHRPPYQHETPLGIFVVQEKKVKMYYLVDGTSNIGGFSPHASRFSNGGYVHGVPVNKPRESIIEYSQTLGTIPRSHMCVRNASSHAEFIYNWGPIDQTLIVVIE